MLPLQQRVSPESSVADVYRPQIFRLQVGDERDALEELLRRRPELEIADTLQRQLWELIKTRHPSRKLSAEEYRRLIAEHLDARPALEYGAWVFYPWSRRLVHLLDEDEFAELRTNRNTYKITPEERAALATKTIGVVGLSVGQSVALVLALERAFGELRLADFDTLDLSNLNRLRAGVHDIGVPKVIVTAREIAEIDPYLHVVCHPEGVTSENLEAFLAEPRAIDLLVEECDSIDLKIEIRHAARRHRIPVLMDTSDRGLLDIERFDLEPDRPIFHGLVGDLDPSQLRGLTTEEKVPYVLKIIGASTISTRLRASLLEIDQTISTWPQLASSVALGGGVAGDVARRILLGETIDSQRIFVDVDLMTRPAVTDERPPESVADRDAWMPQHTSALCGSPHATDVAVDRITRLVAAACLAPSGANAQPWLWQWRDRCLTLVLDARHSWALLDFQSLGAITALGAAAENLVLAAHADGLGIRVTKFPEPAEPTLVATFEFCAKGDTGDERGEADPLAEHIPTRVTNRRTAPRSKLSEEMFTALDTAAAQVPTAQMHWARSDAQLDEVGTLLGAADRLLFLNHRLHQELMTEITFEDSTDGQRGIAVETLELSPSDRAGLEVARSWPALALVKHWGGGANLEKMSRKAIAGASAFGVLTMPRVERAAYFDGGRALERLWLTATKLGVGLQPMSALCYLFTRVHGGGESELEPDTVDGLRRLWPRWARLFDLRESDAQVGAFRLTTAGPPSARSPRCRIEEVLTIA